MPFAIRQIEKIEKTYQHFRRFEEIIKIIFKYNLQNLIEGFELPAPISFAGEKIFHSGSDEMNKMPLAKRVRLALQELGPTFVKFGQIMSLRVELLPEDIIEELTYLQDHVQAFDIKTAQDIIKKELGKEVSELFSGFEEQPIGSASLGQVYKAEIRETGQKIAIKVQRPNIQKAIETDLEILMHLAGFAEKNITEFKYRRPTKFIEEVSYSLEREIDYKQEEAHIIRFKQAFNRDPHVYIMDCFPELSTKKVLTMEYVEGIKVRHIEELDRCGLDRKIIAARGVDSLLKQIFEDGFFHADPHPGNIFVLKDNVVSFIDFGMVGRLSRQNRELMTDFLFAISQRDAYKSTKLLIKLTEHPKTVNHEKLEREIAEIIDRYVSKPLKEVSLAKLFAHLSEILTKHHMIFPSDFSMMLKAIATVEGVGRTLYPELNLTGKLTPYFYRLRYQRFYPSNLLEDMDDTVVRMLEFLRHIPDLLRDLMQQTLSGETSINVEHRGSKAFYKFWNQLVNRLSFSLILAALLISSSIIVQSGVPPKWHNIPVIGLIGFIISGLMSVSLLFSIWKKGMF